MKNQKGFTLIELMIVVAIIAILAAIAISQYQDYVIRSQVSEGSSLADGVKTAVGEFYNNNGRFANNTTNTSYGLALAASISGSYVDSVVISNTGVISAHFSNTGLFKSNKAINLATLLFSPTSHAGSMSWTCRKGAILVDKWVPSSCR